jgi:voltage-gated potassium channel Kch
MKRFFFLDSVIQFIKDDQYRDLLITSTVIILIGSGVYHYLEGWSWVDSIYFSVITLTTIGYGDFAPQTESGKIFTIVYIIVGLGMILSFINAVYEHYNNRAAERLEKNNEEKLNT